MFRESPGNQVVERRRLTRRDFLKIATAAAVSAMIPGATGCTKPDSQSKTGVVEAGPANETSTRQRGYWFEGVGDTLVIRLEVWDTSKLSEENGEMLVLSKSSSGVEERLNISTIYHIRFTATRPDWKQFERGFDRDDQTNQWVSSKLNF